MASSAGSRALWLLVCALAMCQVASAVTPEEVVGWFQDTSKDSKFLRAEVEKVNLFNAALTGGTIERGLDKIISRIEVYSSSLGPANTNTFKDKDAKLVVDALKPFVQELQFLMYSIIRVHGEPALVIYFGRIHDALVDLKSVMDTFAVGILNRIPSQAPAAKEQFTMLDGAINFAISVYSSPI